PHGPPDSLTDEHMIQRSHPHAPSADLWMLCADAGTDRGEISLCCACVDPAAQPANQVQPVIRTVRSRRGTERYPYVRRGKRERPGHDSGDGVRRTVQGDRGSDRILSRIQPLAPEVFADDCNRGWCAWRIL